MSEIVRMQAPRRLSVSKLSPYYDKLAIEQVDRVFVSGEHIPECVAYNMDEGWAIGKDRRTRAWLPRKYGVVTVKMKWQEQ